MKFLELTIEKLEKSGIINDETLLTVLKGNKLIRGPWHEWRMKEYLQEQIASLSIAPVRNEATVLLYMEAPQQQEFRIPDSLKNKK